METHSSYYRKKLQEMKGGIIFHEFWQAVYVVSDHSILVTLKGCNLQITLRFRFFWPAARFLAQFVFTKSMQFPTCILNDFRQTNYLHPNWWPVTFGLLQVQDMKYYVDKVARWFWLRVSALCLVSGQKRVENALIDWVGNLSYWFVEIYKSFSE